MTGLLVLLAVEAVAVVLLVLLVTHRPRPRTLDQGADVLPFRHGVIRHRRCEECGRLVEEHRAVRIGDGWFCLDVNDCMHRRDELA